MNEERKEQILVIVKMLIVVVCASLYAWGGMENRQLLRRFLAPCIAGLTIAMFSRNWWALFTAPLLYGASSLGYGGGSVFWGRVFKRLYCGLAFGLGGSLNNIMRKNWLLVVTQLVVIVSLFTIYGVFNPFNSARIEEAVLGLFIYAIPIMSARSKE